MPDAVNDAICYVLHEVEYVTNMVVNKMSDPKKPSNLKTGLIIGGIALFFFVMVFVKRIWL